MKSRGLNFICTNIPETTDSLLASRQKHDMNEWEKLCSDLKLETIHPVSLIRLNRSIKSPHKDQPRLLKVTVNNEKELEDILLSAYLLRDGRSESRRIYPDVPLPERLMSSKNTDGNRLDRSLVLLGVPEASSTDMRNVDPYQDAEQWRYISNLLGTNDVTVMDTFRIPLSPKYEGSGPRPLKLTFLNSSMKEKVQAMWRERRHTIPREVRLSSTHMTPNSIIPRPDITNANLENIEPPKNGVPPTPVESVTQ